MKNPVQKFPILESPHNPLYRRLKSLTHSKGLKKEGLFILSGEKLITEFLKSTKLAITYIVRTPSMPSLEIGYLKTSHKNLILTPALFAELDSLGTHYPLLIVEQPTLSSLSAAQFKTYHPRGLEVVIPLGDPSNLGALIRSCEAFGIKKVILTKEAAHPYLPKAIKASAGSLLRLHLTLGPSLQELPSTMIALDAGGLALEDFSWPKDALLVLGEEGPGFSQNRDSLRSRFQHCLKVTTSGVESLNGVVAASIALYHYSRAHPRLS